MCENHEQYGEGNGNVATSAEAQNVKKFRSADINTQNFPDKLHNFFATIEKILNWIGSWWWWKTSRRRGWACSIYRPECDDNADEDDDNYNDNDHDNNDDDLDDTYDGVNNDHDGDEDQVEAEVELPPFIGAWVSA